jgi:hypothetical protein
MVVSITAGFARLRGCVLGETLSGTFTINEAHSTPRWSLTGKRLPEDIHPNKTQKEESMASSFNAYNACDRANPTHRESGRKLEVQGGTVRAARRQLCLTVRANASGASTSGGSRVAEVARELLSTFP